MSYSNRGNSLTPKSALRPYFSRILLPTKNSNDSLSEISSPKQHTPQKDRGMLTTLFNFSLRSPSTLSNKSSCRRTNSVRTPIDQTPRVINEDSQLSTIEKALRIIESRKRSSHSVEEITPQKPSKKSRNETFSAVQTSQSSSISPFPDNLNQSCSVKTLPKKVVRKRASYVPSHILEAHVFGEEATAEPDLSKVDLSIQESACQPELSASNDDISPHDSLNSNNSEIENRPPLAPVTRVDSVAQFVANLEARTQSNFKRGVLKRGLRSVVRSQTQPVGSDFESRVDKIRKLLSNVFEHSPEPVQNQVTLLSSIPTNTSFSSTPVTTNSLPPVISTPLSIATVPLLSVSKPQTSASPLATVSTDSPKSSSAISLPPSTVSVAEVPKLNFDTPKITIAESSLPSSAVTSSSDTSSKPTFNFGTPKTITETSTLGGFSFSGPKTTAAPATTTSLSFSFGASATPKTAVSLAPTTTAISFTTSTTSSVTPSFSFGDKAGVSSPSVNSSTKNETVSSAPFSFGSKPNICSATTSESKSIFSFGSSTAKSSSEVSTLAAGKSSFAFGGSTPSTTGDTSKPELPKPAFNFATAFKPPATTTATNLNDVPFKPGLSFGTMSAASETTSKPSFAFPAQATISDTLTKPTFCFSAKPSENSTNQVSIFGASVPMVNTTEKPSFSFGTSAASACTTMTTKPSFSFVTCVTTAAENSVTKPTFSFNAPATTSSGSSLIKLPLSFGAAVTTSTETANAKPLFNFGSGATSTSENSTIKQSLNFGSPFTSASELPKPFSFGGSTTVADSSTAKPSLSFGSTNDKDSTKAAFNFGSSSQTTTTANSLFNLASKPSTENPLKTGGFNFGGAQATPAEIPKASAFSFAPATTEAPKQAITNTFNSSANNSSAAASLFNLGGEKTSTTSASLFNFGSSTNSNTIAQNKSTPTVMSTSGFTFGAAQPTKSSFAFGSAPITTATPAFGVTATTKPSFSFGGSATSSVNGSLNTSAIFTPKEETKSGGLFASTSVKPTPSTSFNFGGTQQPSGYNFGENKPAFGSFQVAPSPAPSTFTFGQSKMGAFGSSTSNGFGTTSPMFGSTQNVFGSSDGGNAFSVANSDARRKVLPRRRR